MSKVITFSRSFPSYHPKKGMPTHFVEQVWDGMGGVKDEYRKHFEDYDDYRKSILWGYRTHGSKYHTVRSGNRWKVGDMASLRVWGNDVNPKSGRSGPYHSKQIIIAPDVEIKYCPSIEIYKTSEIIIGGNFYARFDTSKSWELALNDGLTEQDFKDWFKYPKQDVLGHQIICWADHIKY